MLIAKPLKLSLTFCPEAAEGASIAMATPAAANMHVGTSSAFMLLGLIAEVFTIPLLERNQHRRRPGDVHLVADLDRCERLLVFHA